MELFTTAKIDQLGKKIEKMGDKMGIPWLKNTRGKPDAIFTLGVIAFFVCLIGTFLGLLQSVELFGKVVSFQPIPATNILALLGPTLTAYVAKRYQEVKYEKMRKNETRK